MKLILYTYKPQKNDFLNILIVKMVQMCKWGMQPVCAIAYKINNIQFLHNLKTLTS